MKIGSVIVIKNPAGALNVRIEKELSLEDVTKGLGDDKIPDLVRPRLEYHKGSYGEHLITLCDNEGGFPFKMYIVHIHDWGDKPTCYLGVCDETEDSVFETVY